MKCSIKCLFSLFVLVPAFAQAEEIKLSCEVRDKGVFTIVYTLNDKSSDLVVDDDFIAGFVVEEKHHLKFKYPKSEKRYETRITVNRYTGEFQWEHGNEPFGELSDQNIVRAGMCKKSAIKKLF